MLVFKDILTDEELFSDSYPMKLVDELYYKVTGKLTSESSEIDESKIGGNASAEGGAEAVAENAVSGVDIVLANRLQELQVDKKSYMILFKEYAKNLVKYYTENRPDEVEDLKVRLVTLQKEIKLWWKTEEFQVFQGWKGESEGMFALLGYEGGDVPYMIFFKDGLQQEKF